ncbi:hypothetical protein H6P81_014444 [Aristolochia fimbriata]|uniref:Uncharacterized protein n=1 Tax=Aristolochia fimbriata TaxID=158543 RepID=A0AAV7EKC1_ARIFI|nr:hypothetical protein H6P81_014444 [Aristolochia fimbriata]
MLTGGSSLREGMRLMPASERQRWAQRDSWVAITSDSLSFLLPGHASPLIGSPRGIGATKETGGTKAIGSFGKLAKVLGF